MSRLAARAAPLLAASLALAGCGWLTRPAPRAEAPAPLIPYGEVAGGQRCDAHALASLVGKPRFSLPAPVEPINRRVSCNTCPPPEDYRPERTNILFDARSGLITAVTCG